ncbi:hypothetical protein [Ruicaihuangia caeni]|uniref:Uncharacterized protein n=1 Tax=Ruicaihuangia caeni TaxID=3042517 RepID=A0AAW6T9X8_9MICO|nr:hypothetical protein [Klugiella sp. YN-L-19]MDI2097952.1 hypothetical protein [Klugiella sp. YN-L-19]
MSGGFTMLGAADAAACEGGVCAVPMRDADDAQATASVIDAVVTD